MPSKDQKVDAFKNKLKTTFAYSKNLFVTGALSKTSRKTEVEVCKHLPKIGENIFVEYGMGLGNITREILRNISPESTLYSFEVNKDFCKQVAESINDERLIIINDGAENMQKHIKREIHGVVGTIPFSFFSKEKASHIIQGSYDILADNHYYTQALYTKFNFKKFEKVFEDCYMVKISRIPQEVVYHCKKAPGK